MNRTKKFGTMLLCTAMITSMAFSSTGCTFFDKYTEENITETADKFCKAICNMNPDPASRCVIDEDTVGFFTEYTFAADEDEEVVFEAIADSLSYELDTDSVEINRKSGKCSIDAEFSLTDYEKIYNDGEVFYYPEDLAEAIKSGKDTIEIHSDAIAEDDVVLLHDDLLATGGSMNAAYQLVKEFNPKKTYINFIIELTIEGN